MKWTAHAIGRHLANVTFQKKNLVLVPNCNWTGHECDILVLTMNLRIIDVEIKVSRADLKADASKDKWYHQWDYKIDGPWRPDRQDRRPREWPRKVWKHYYALPRDVWDDSLLTSIPKVSGVLLIYEWHGNLHITVERPAKPNRDAEPVSAESAIDIARLANIRMWNALAEVDRVRGKTTEAA